MKEAFSLNTPRLFYTGAGKTIFAILNFDCHENVNNKLQTYNIS